MEHGWRPNWCEVAVAVDVAVAVAVAMDVDMDVPLLHQGQPFSG
jgi:hypothetical protein